MNKEDKKTKQDFPMTFMLGKKIVYGFLSVTKRGFALWVIDKEGKRESKHWVLDASTIGDDGTISIAQHSEKIWDISFKRSNKNFKWNKAEYTLIKESQSKEGKKQ